MTARTAAMRRAVRSGDLERIALYLALAILRAARETPPATIDDVLAVLARGDEDDDRRTAH
jgi:hypothetical protein